MPHIKSLDRNSVPQFKELFDHYVNTRGFVPNSILTMSRRPEIAEAFMALNKAVLYEGTVAEETKMLISLIASQAAGCRYCQAHMANLANKYNASRDKIAAVWEYRQSPLFSDAERAALDLAFHASLVPNQAGEEHFGALKKHYSDSEIVEIVASISLFGYLNRWNDTMATSLEDFPHSVASELLAGTDWEVGKHQ